MAITFDSAGEIFFHRWIRLFFSVEHDGDNEKVPFCLV